MPDPSLSAQPPLRQKTPDRLMAWARRVRLSRKLAYTLTIANVIAGIATFISMTGSQSFGLTPRAVLVLLYVDAVLLLALTLVVIRRLVRVWAERTRGTAGSRLHSRLVVLFSLVAVTPAILVAIFAGLYLNLGMQSWFSERVQTALESSNRVSEAYLQEHVQAIRAEILTLASDLNRNAPQISRSPALLNGALTQLSNRRGIPEAAILNPQGAIMALSALTLSFSVEGLPLEYFESADTGDVVVIANQGDDRVRALVKLERFIDAYLLVGRLIDPEVLASIDRTRTAYSQYVDFEEQREGIQISFVMIFVLVAFMLLLASSWVGLIIANQLARPISELIEAAGKVRDGDLSARVELGSREDEISRLSHSFNRMTEQLGSQRDELVATNRELDERSQFTETVLAGVSAGVIGLDEDGMIYLPNRFACLFLDLPAEDLKGQHLLEVLPELTELWNRSLLRVDDEIQLVRKGVLRVIRVVIAAEKGEEGIIGYVVTFDDITELQSAQRRAAWANVARRIAHEIKNPLTPIQLSAERLKRKYLKEVESDKKTFETCTDTIIRQVEDMRQMVDEFSAFARMPQPKLKPENLTALCHDAVFLERNRGNDDIRFDLSLPEDTITLLCDRQQISRVLTNLLKNAAEAIEGKYDDRQVETDRAEDSIALALDKQGEDVVIRIDDTGKGLPADERDRLTDPYVTTRTKGTGLGLAIVKKIMEDNNGALELRDREGGGASVILTFSPIDEHLVIEENTDPMSVASSMVTR